MGVLIYLLYVGSFFSHVLLPTAIVLSVWVLFYRRDNILFKVTGKLIIRTES